MLIAIIGIMMPVTSTKAEYKSAESSARAENPEGKT